MDEKPAAQSARSNEGFSGGEKEKSAMKNCPRWPVLGSPGLRHFLDEKPIPAWISMPYKLVAEGINQLRDDQRSFVVHYPLPAPARLPDAGTRFNVPVRRTQSLKVAVKSWPHGWKAEGYGGFSWTRPEA